MSIPFDLNIASLQSYAGVTRVQLRGINAAISTSAETVWNAGATYARLASAVALEALSSDANDTAAGTGARTVEIDLVDGDYVASTVTAILNGTTPVAITGTFVGVNGVRVATAGSGLVNAGTISVRTVSGSVNKSTISANADSSLALGVAADFLYTIPAGCVGLLKPIRFSTTGATGDISVFVRKHNSAGLISHIGAGKVGLSNTGINQGVGVVDFGSGIRIAEKELIELRAIASAGAGSLVAMADLFVFDTTKTGLVSL